MANITRGTKASAGGGTAFVTATPILPDEVNTDFDTAYAEINGNLDSTNLKAAAAIAETQIDDISATAATHDDTTTPGDSSSHTLPTTLSGELQQLRYVEERLALGIAATRVDGSGTGTTGWYDLPVRGPNLIVNPNFSIDCTDLVATQPVPGWGDLTTGTPTFTRSLLSGGNQTEGLGYEFRIQAGSAAVAGVFQSPQLKKSTQYLVVARVRVTAGTAKLFTESADAASAFRDFTVSTSSSTYTTLKGVIKTSSTNPIVAIRVSTGGTNGADIKVSYVGLYECNADFLPVGASPTSKLVSTAATVLGSAAFAAIVGPITMVVPGDDYEIHLNAFVPIANGNASVQTVAVRLTESGTELTAWEATMPANSTATAVISYKLPPSSLIAGTAYAFSISGRSTAAASLTINGTSLVTGTGTRTASLSARLVKASG